MTALILRGDARHLPLPDGSVDLIMTSPPYYGLRSYTDNGGKHYEWQIGSEATPQEWLAAMLACTREFMRVLKPEGSLFVNLGDKYATTAPGRLGASGSKTAYARNGYRDTRGFVRDKSLLGLPWRYALACIDDLGLILRAEIVWAKPNGLPESVTDRVRRAHEQIFHLVKQPRYYAAVDEIREPQQSLGRGRPWAQDVDGTVPTWGINGTQSLKGGRTTDQMNALNPLGKLPGSVWNIPSQPLTVPAELGVDHFAAYPMELPRRIIQGWTPPGICTRCRHARKPIVQRDEIDPAYLARNRRRPDGVLNGRSVSSKSILRTGLQSGQSPPTRILGYRCGCEELSPQNPAARPAVVLDPFGGTGTTALLAHALGRTGITIDRSADYSRLAAWRTTDPGELARAMQVDKPPVEVNGQEALWA